MIRREENEGWFLINQHDHAALSGQTMNYWGNEAFEPPDPRDELLFAITEHDNGWREWDSSPKVETQTGYPMNFMEMDFPDQKAIWTRSFGRFSEDHPYASALIALHFRVFNQKIIDKDDGNSEAKRLNFEMNKFIANSLNLEFSNSGLPPVPKKAKINLRLVQVGDIISLALCHGWPSIDIDAAPLNYEGTALKLKLTSSDGKNYIINPYPFSQDKLRFQIIGRKLGRKQFNSDAVLRRILNESNFETLELLIKTE
jgi:Protein of unknown function (DUF3891)